MGSDCGWRPNGVAKFSAVVARKDVNGSLCNSHLNTPAHRSFSFARRSRLTSEADLESLRRTGKRMQTEFLEARVSVSLSLCTRVGIVVPKYGRTVVDRNRTKRRLREIVRSRLLPAVANMDVLIRAKPKAYTASFSELAVQMNDVVNWVSELARPR
jgi:ribonuclease P protein component